ncbi:MAG: sodium-dependent bicarbonate transport family permease [Pseudomonadota bacterium]
MSTVAGFFLLGFIARLIRSDVEFPQALYQSLTIFLLLAIGLKGGLALQDHASIALAPQAIAVVCLGLALPLVAFPLLSRVGKLSRADAASIAAHYGSVSVGTYAVAVAVLEARGIPYEAYFPLFVVLLEMPAIAVGLALAGSQGAKMDRSKLLHECFCNQGVVLMVGGMAIGYFAGDAVQPIMPLFGDLFQGVLALFLLEMGLVAASRLSDIRSSAPFITSFGVVMPLVGGAAGAVLGTVLGLSAGGIALLAALGGSASYIAVPAVMRQALPSANHGLSIATSLAVTFPFNVLVGIPLYISAAHWLHATYNGGVM